MIEDSAVNTPYYHSLEDKLLYQKDIVTWMKKHFFSDTFHEIAHSTGHEKRLKRDLKADMKKKITQLKN